MTELPWERDPQYLARLAVYGAELRAFLGQTLAAFDIPARVEGQIGDPAASLAERPELGSPSQIEDQILLVLHVHRQDSARTAELVAEAFHCLETEAVDGLPDDRHFVASLPEAFRPVGWPRSTYGYPSLFTIELITHPDEVELGRIFVARWGGRTGDLLRFRLFDEIES